jgi:hypothetical protein
VIATLGHFDELSANGSVAAKRGVRSWPQLGHSMLSSLAEGRPDL